MADEEAQNQEQNAEATEAVEAGAEAVEAAPVEEPKAQSILMPLLITNVITIAGVAGMFYFVLPGMIKSAIPSGDSNSTAYSDSGDKKGDEKGKDEKSKDEKGEDDADETADPAAEPDDPTKPVPIVPEGESIVVNPANSAGTRYLLVEIFLIRKEEEDTGFPKAVESKTKQLQAITMDILSEKDVQELSEPYTKDAIKAALKRRYELLIGDKHPIKELIVSKWIMQ
mgnify:CR=1 FL=1